MRINTTQTTLSQLEAGFLKPLLEKVVAKERTESPIRTITREVSVALKGQRAVNARLNLEWEWVRRDGE